MDGKKAQIDRGKFSCVLLRPCSMSTAFFYVETIVLAGSGLGERFDSTSAEIQRVGSGQVHGKPPRPRLCSTHSFCVCEPQ